MKCPHCQQDMPEPEAPVAHPLHMQFVGRQVFTVDGHSGIWCGEPDRFDDGDKAGLVVKFENPQRGRERRKTLYRLDSLTAQIKKALECTP